MANCYLCNSILNKKTSSWEHILPFSIGGTLKSKRLICKNCNELAGRTIDKALADYAVGKPYDEASFLRSIVKIVTGFYYYKRKEILSVAQPIQYILGNSSYPICFPENLELAKKDYDGKRVHIILLKGDADRNYLNGYLELYGAHGFTVKLNTSYPLSSFECRYVYDSVAHEVIMS